MQKKAISEILKGNAYPGRGILVGRSEDGKSAVCAYFIMGRSVNSRNRVFKEEGEGIRTEAFDESKLSDPSLIIYAPVRVLGSRTVITNGDQTDTVYEALASGGTFEGALRTREFEPDAPNYTPRISALVDTADGGFIHTYMMDGDPLPSFEGEPERAGISGDIDEFTKALWESLDEDNKVSLFVRYIDIDSGEYDTRIVNKNI